MNFGHRVRKAREALKMSQAILASKLGQPNSFIVKLERGEPVRMSAATKLEIMRILNIHEG